MSGQSSLEQVIGRSGPLSPRQAAAIGLAVLDQLVALHNRGILHGDVRPSTVLLGPHDRILLAGPSLPSRDFTPPEGVTSPAADLWSLGATLYTAVQGRPPAPGGSLDNAGPIAALLFGLLAGDPARRPDPGSVRNALLGIFHHRAEPPALMPTGSPVPSATPTPPFDPGASARPIPGAPAGHPPGPAGPGTPFQDPARPFAPGAPDPLGPGTPASSGHDTSAAPNRPTPETQPSAHSFTLGAPDPLGPGSSGPGSPVPAPHVPGPPGPSAPGVPSSGGQGGPGAHAADGPAAHGPGSGVSEVSSHETVRLSRRPEGDGTAQPVPAVAEATVPVWKNPAEQTAAIVSGLPLGEVPDTRPTTHAVPGALPVQDMPRVQDTPPAQDIPLAHQPSPSQGPAPSQEQQGQQGPYQSHQSPPQDQWGPQGHQALPSRSHAPQEPPLPPGVFPRREAPAHAETSPRHENPQPHPGVPRHENPQPHPGVPRHDAPDHPGMPSRHEDPPSLPSAPAPGAAREAFAPGDGVTGPTEHAERSRGILVPRPVVALTGALLFGMAVTIGVLLGPVIAGSGEDEFAPEPSGAKGRFAAAPRACSLLSDKQAAELVPNFTSSEVERAACDWLNRHDWRNPNVEKYDLRVRLVAQKQDGSGITRAKEYLAGKKKDFADKGQFATPKPTPPKDLRGVGEEAFVSGSHNSINLYGGSYKVTVVFRISNLIAEVEYERAGVKDDPDGSITAGAVKAARWLTASLKSDD
ncbi:hypothetical protein GCM10010517_26100 [Streptosporangium fragile]|uniref:Protein kinase domain-containing protein n=1 Tax=Streptosporangium fragile TaxID=46186 RepID=A0ABN3VVI4_9ACTN